MTTPTNSYYARCMAEMERDVDRLNYLNEKQTVFTRQMTEEEMAEIFGGNPDAIKNLGHGDGHEWSKYENNVH